MKVLWFSNTPCGAFSDKLKGTGGWLEALDNAIQNEIDLHIAFHYPYKKNSFKNGNTTYHPIYTGNIILTNLRDRWRTVAYDAQFLSSYTDIIKRINPDIIHIHGTENPYLCIANETTIPVVVSIQGIINVINHKFCSGFGHFGLYKRIWPRNFKDLVLGKPTFGKGKSKLNKMAKIENKRINYIKNFIGRTDWDRRVSQILSPESTYYIGNELLRESFYLNKWEPIEHSPSHLIIHTTNGNNFYKGFETLCHALSLLNNQGIDVEWRVAGISENSLINKIAQKYLGRDYPTKGLVLMGPLSEDELVDSLLSSHIYVMPSHIENSPNNLCEAMILGLPSIATFAGGTSSLVTDKKDGILIQDGDPWSMAGAILELKNNWSQTLEYGRSARQRALIRHDKNTIVKQLIETYETIIKNKFSI